jgi:allantoin racemase
MKHIVLINPNTSTATTSMMTGIARGRLPAKFSIEGMTAQRGVPMILNGDQLAAAAASVVEMGMAAAEIADGIIIGAFGDPGIEQLRSSTDVPVVGICEASMLEASKGGRRFGIATVTPDLVESFSGKAQSLGLGHLYTGTRLTAGDPEELASDPAALEDTLVNAVDQCFKIDGSQAVIIGGGPLGQAALGLSQRFSAPLIAPIASAVDLLILQMVAYSVDVVDSGR